jgi:exodeoxyribonuclease VII small subunit
MSKKTKVDATADSESTDFEADLAALEQTVRDLEAGNTPLARSLELFESGVRLLERCRKTLDGAEVRIRELVDVEEDGTYRFKRFAHEASTKAAEEE